MDLITEPRPPFGPAAHASQDEDEQAHEAQADQDESHGTQA